MNLRMKNEKRERDRERARERARERERERERGRERILEDQSARYRDTDKYGYFIPRM